jgi:hypothetical protein
VSDTFRALFLLFGLTLTQSGCFTLITATACAASKASDCGNAIAAAAAIDVAVVELAFEAPFEGGGSSGRGYYDDCIGDSMPCEDDPDACCYE